MTCMLHRPERYHLHHRGGWLKSWKWCYQSCPGLRSLSAAAVSLFQCPACLRGVAVGGGLVKVKSSMASILPVETLLPQNVGSIINYLQ